MKNETNIYDVDGELIRKVGDNHHMTVEEAQKRIDFYREKLQNIEKTDKNYDVYTTYINNLGKYILNEYSKMPLADLQNLVNKETQNVATQEEINRALNELKDEFDKENRGETGEVDREMEQPVEVDNPTIMDEYVEFEEIPNENENN